MSALGALLFVSCLLPDDPAPAQAADPSRIAQSATDRFDFRSAFWVNLHHFLYARARVAKGLDRHRDSVAGAADDDGAIDALDPEERAGFDDALEWYGKNLADRDILFDAVLRDTTTAIARRENADSPRGDGIGDDVASALEQAAAAYRKAWWPAHDRDNRAWLATLEPLLEKHAADLSDRIADVYGAEWPGSMRVDLVAWANWAGAYTTNDPNRVTIGVRSPGNAGLYALESLFHEASHAMDGTLGAALESAAKRHDVTLPRDFWHVIIFFTAGELVRRLHPEHVPYAQKFGLYQRVPGWQAQRAICDEFWIGVLDGSVARDDALDKMVLELKSD